MTKALFNNYIHLIEKDPLQNFVPNTMTDNKTARLSFQDSVERSIMVEEMESLMYSELEIYFSHQKTNRQKLVDHIYKDVDSRYRLQKEGVSDIKNRSKKRLEKKQRSRRVAGFFLKMNGLPIDEHVHFDFLDTIVD